MYCSCQIRCYLLKKGCVELFDLISRYGVFAMIVLTKESRPHSQFQEMIDRMNQVKTNLNIQFISKRECKPEAYSAENRMFLRIA